MAPAWVAETERFWKSVRAFVMVLGKVPGMDQKSEFAATLATACAKVLVTGWMSKSGMVLAMAPASVPAMDWMM